MICANENRIGRIAAAVLVFVLVSANAQDEVDEETPDDETIEEIIVIGGEKPGDPIDVDALYEEMLRERLMLDADQLRAIAEEDAWRAASTTEVEEPSRIQWGYDAEEELRMRRESDLDNVPFVTTRPATLFRVGF